MKINFFISFCLTGSYLILNGDMSLHIISCLNNFSLFDLACLKNLLPYKLALSECQYYNIPQYTFNIVDISKLANLHQDFMENPSW